MLALLLSVTVDVIVAVPMIMDEHRLERHFLFRPFEYLPEIQDDQKSPILRLADQLVRLHAEELRDLENEKRMAAPLLDRDQFLERYGQDLAIHHHSAVVVHRWDERPESWKRREFRQ